MAHFRARYSPITWRLRKSRGLKGIEKEIAQALRASDEALSTADVVKRTGRKSREISAVLSTLEEQGFVKGHKEILGYAAVFYDPLRHPQEKYVTLRTKDKRVAMRRKVELEKKESLGEFDPWTDSAPQEGVTVEDAIKRYLKERQHLRPKTLRADESTLNLFAGSLPPACLLAQIEPDHVEKFLSAPKKPRTPRKDGRASETKPKKLSSATRQTYYTRIRAFLTWCNENGMMRHDPTKKVERPKLVRKEKPFLTHEQYDRLRRAIEADAVMKEKGMIERSSLREGEIRWLLDVIEIAVSTGLRVTELVHMKWSWVSFDAGLIVVRNDGEFLPKSHHERTIPVSGSAMDVLRRLNAARTTELDDYVFKGLQSDEKLDATFVSKRFKEYVILAKIPDNFTFHTLRHTFCTWMIQAGVPVPVVQKLAGHANIATTMQYVHVAGGDLHDAVTKMQERRAVLSAL